MSSALSHWANKKRLHVFTNWASIEKTYYPSQKQKWTRTEKLILKYQKSKASACHAHKRLVAQNSLKRLLENPFTRTVLRPAHASTASASGFLHRKILRNGEYAAFPTSHEGEEKFFLFPLRFTAMTARCGAERAENGDMAAGFGKEFRNCGNGYYYLLVNDEYMIGYDID